MQSKKQFDPDIVQIFQKVIGIYPNNTHVKLSDNSIVRIIKQNDILPLRPVVSIVTYPDGTRAKTVEMINLMERRDLVITKVIE